MNDNDTMFKYTPEIDSKILRKYTDYINSTDSLVGNISRPDVTDNQGRF